MKKQESNEDLQMSFAERVLEKVRRILDKYLENFSGHKELKEFMENEENLYDSNGKPTEKYKAKIKEVENFIKQKSIDDTLYEFFGKTEEDKAVLNGIIEFVDKRRDIIKEYKNEEDDWGEDFDPENFIYTLLKNSDPEEKQNVIEIMKNLAEIDALDALDEDAVREGIKKIINYKEQ